MTRLLLVPLLVAAGLTVATDETPTSGRTAENQDGYVAVTSSLDGRPARGALNQTSAQAAAFVLEDQFGTSHDYSFPKDKVSVLLLADKKGAKQVESWVVPLYERYEDAIDIDGVADLRAVPSFLHGTVRFFFKRNAERPIMLDWDGSVTAQFQCEAGCVNLFVLSKTGHIRATSLGPSEEPERQQIFATVDALLDASSDQS